MDMAEVLEAPADMEAPEDMEVPEDMEAPADTEEVSEVTIATTTITIMVVTTIMGKRRYSKCYNCDEMLACLTR